MVVHVALLALSKGTAVLHLLKLAPFLWPFNLCLPVARHLPDALLTLSSSASLLALRLRVIGSSPHRRNLTRWDRALRLFHRELFVRRRSGDELLPQQSRLLSNLDASIIQGLLSLSI